MSNNTTKIRTRFAPSPTGFMHVGGLRTALYAYLFAKKAGGDFILRIEDTDQSRYVEGAVEVIYDTLRTCGLNWDEGPDIGGAYGPYIQSERMATYMEYAKKLVEAGHAYYCFCDKERMDALHAEQKAAGQIAGSYDRHCRALSPEEVSEKLNAATPFVIRQKMPTEGQTTFHDEVFGDITVDNTELDDQILIKSDGMPTYNFANVIDDHLMEITHIVRGSEFLSSTPKYIRLYEAFGWAAPVFIHAAPIMRDARHKLSKRDGDAYFEDFVAKGYLVPAIINYIALLGWAPKGEQEIFSLEELGGVFALDGISKSPALFDEVKMKAINAMHIRLMTPEQYKTAALPYIEQGCARRDIDLDVLCAVLQPRTELMTDIAPQLDFIDELPEYDLALYSNKKMKTSPETALPALREALPVLEALETFTKDSVHEALFALIERLGVKNGYILWPVRVAVSGKALTPGGGVELCAILGRKETLARIRKGIELLENLS